jgi:hypothetical protein
MANNLVIDAADPNSLAMVLPVELADRVRALPHQLLVLDEQTLTTLIDPSLQQKRVKIQFWDEYEKALREARSVMLSNICFGVCTKEYLMEFTINVKCLAWLVSPRPSYKLRVAELIDRGMDCLERVFDLPTDGEKAVSVLRLQMDALKMLDMRKHGGYTQRAEIKTQEIPVHGGANETAPLGEGSIEELEKQVVDLESRIQGGKNQNGSLLNVGSGVAIDVSPGMVRGR